MKAFPWRFRWLQVVLSEIPIFAIFATGLFIERFYYYILLYIWIVVYMMIFAIHMVKTLREYNHLQSYAKDGHIPSKNWTMWVLGIGVSIVLLYISLYPYFDDTTIENAYLVSNLLLNIAIAYFVWKQRPENTMELAKIRVILQEERDIIKNKIEEMEKQMEVLSEKEIQIDELTSEMHENAEKLKRKASIKEYMDTMRLQHPQLEPALNRIAIARLTNHDILLCMLIYDGRKVSYIAKMTGVNVKSVEMGRSRLRKKLNLSPEQNLNDFIKGLGIGK